MTVDFTEQQLWFLKRIVFDSGLANQDDPEHAYQCADLLDLLDTVTAPTPASADHSTRIDL